MTEITIDCMGMACPQPLMTIRKALEKDAPERLMVLVDDEAALENVGRYLSVAGYEVHSAKIAGVWTVSAVLGESAVAEAPAAEDYACAAPSSGSGPGPGEAQKLVVFLSADTLGKGDDGLGGKLMTNFLKTLPELGQDLWRIICVNGAVRLTAVGSPHVEALQALETAGVSVLVCGTCLEFFGLLDKKAVGQTTNMLDVVTSLQLASKVISL